jgi:hypothetical protein
MTAKIEIKGCQHVCPKQEPKSGESSCCRCCYAELECFRRGGTGRVAESGYRINLSHLLLALYHNQRG